MDGNTPFPNVDIAMRDPNGLLAYGGDLSTERLIQAYSQGIFPWYSEDEPIMWWTPDPRSVLYPERFHCSRSLKKFIKRQPYSVYWNRDFKTVINACAQPRPTQPSTWITPEMQQAYVQMFNQGYAFCLEIEYQGTLAGGIYGVCLDSIFFGESMFSTATNGSKIALMELCKHMLDNNIYLLDCQVHSEHVASLGASCISREQFHKTLSRHIRLD